MKVAHETFLVPAAQPPTPRSLNRRTDASAGAAILLWSRNVILLWSRNTLGSRASGVTGQSPHQNNRARRSRSADLRQGIRAAHQLTEAFRQVEHRRDVARLCGSSKIVGATPGLTLTPQHCGELWSDQVDVAACTAKKSEGAFRVLATSDGLSCERSVLQKYARAQSCLRKRHNLDPRLAAPVSGRMPGVHRYSWMSGKNLGATHWVGAVNAAPREAMQLQRKPGAAIGPEQGTIPAFSRHYRWIVDIAR
jgi:hypothetical protein